MVGQQAQLRQQLRDRAARLWNGISKVRVNLGTAIVDDPQQVASELLSYWRLGIDEIILSGFPHEEECRRAAAEVLPPLRAAIDRERHEHAYTASRKTCMRYAAQPETCR